MSGKINAFIRKNSPNPFRNNAEFKFGVNLDSEVTIEVFDMTGKKIKTLTQGLRSAGIYTIRWDGINDIGQEVDNGLYNITINAGAATNSMQMFKMK